MIDPEKLIKQQRGMQQFISALKEPEKLALQVYCQWMNDSLYNEGKARQLGGRSIALNAMQMGVAIGLSLTSKDGELQNR